MSATLTAPNLLDLDLAGYESLAVSLGARPFHGRNLFKWVHKHGAFAFDAMTDLPKGLRVALAETVAIRMPQIVEEHRAPDGTTKWALELADGQRIETVAIPEGRRLTLCLSSQVGCALNCAFCATARQGFNRNLSVAEIIGQVWQAVRRLGRVPTNAVMMGMGEPLANFESVVKAMAIMQDDLAYMLAKHRVTLSTSGLVPQIYRLREVSQVSLAVSLHAPTDDLRDLLVPINRKYPLAELIPACQHYVAGDPRRKVTWEYVMLDGVNDSLAQAKQLIRLLEGVHSKVNLIPFNPFPGSAFRTSPPERIAAFQARLMRSGIITLVRKTRGDAVSAACGQLVGRVADRTGRTAVKLALGR